MQEQQTKPSGSGGEHLPEAANISTRESDRAAEVSGCSGIALPVYSGVSCEASAAVERVGELRPGDQQGARKNQLRGKFIDGLVGKTVYKIRTFFFPERSVWPFGTYCRCRNGSKRTQLPCDTVQARVSCERTQREGACGKLTCTPFSILTVVGS